MMKIKDVAAVMEEIAPARLAEEWDHVGLQVGDADAEVSRLLVALTPTPGVLDEAARWNAQLVVSHHPLIFKPLESLTTATAGERLAVGFVRNGVGLFAAHTNYDSAPGGINDALAECLGLHDVRPMATARAKLHKFVVFLPHENLEAVAAAICEAGAGSIGEYSHCTFRSEGTGTFLPSERARPHIGEAGRLERVPEVRLESIMPANRTAAVVQAMLAAHPYEEPAFDIFPLENEFAESRLGRCGTLPRPMPAREFAEFAAKALDAACTRFAGDPEALVTDVAVCGGGGADLFPEAIARGCQAYVTGDVKYHTFADARDAGLVIVDAGHAETELPGVKALCRRLHEALHGVEVRLANDDGRAAMPARRS